MVIEKLSAQTAKIRLTKQELAHIREEMQTRTVWLPQVAAVLMQQAETAVGIPFSQNPVAVELLSDTEGGAAVYFSILRQEPVRGNRRTVRLAARFPDRTSASKCASQLIRNQNLILRSEAYTMNNEWILCLKMIRSGASVLHHALLEYGKPYRLTPVSSSRLLEYGTCQYAENAVRHLAES